MTVAPPFPWFGGKSRVSDLVWSRLGDVPNYVEPFAGSLAVLLNRPHEPHIETVNDLDCYLSNFWRALQADPDGVAHWADWPINEADLHARHWWLVRQSGFRERMHAEADYYDVKLAGWWVWGICQWIGSGWCHMPEWQKRPHLGNAGMGVHRPSQQRPHLGGAGMGVHRPSQQRPHLGNAGMGVHRPSQQLPHLGNLGMGDLYAYMRALAARLRRVRVCCGDWSRVLGPTPTVHMGLTGIFLDPPYSDEERDGDLYAVDSMTVAHDVREWALEHGDDPQLRIALCGYEGEHAMPDMWECVAWKARGGYGTQRQDGDNENRHRERIWFSPHCLKVTEPLQLEMEL